MGKIYEDIAKNYWKRFAEKTEHRSKDRENIETKHRIIVTKWLFVARAIELTYWSTINLDHNGLDTLHSTQRHDYRPSHNHCPGSLITENTEMRCRLMSNDHSSTDPLHFTDEQLTTIYHINEHGPNNVTNTIRQFDWFETWVEISDINERKIWKRWCSGQRRRQTQKLTVSNETNDEATTQ